MKKNAYRLRKHRGTSLSTREAPFQGKLGTEAELIAEELRGQSDDFFNPDTELVSDWRNIKPKQGPEAE